MTLSEIQNSSHSGTVENEGAENHESDLSADDGPFELHLSGKGCLESHLLTDGQLSCFAWTLRTLQTSCCSWSLCSSHLRTAVEQNPGERCPLLTIADSRLERKSQLSAARSS